MSGVEFPEMRREVMRALASLADLEFQQEVWPDPEAPEDFGMNVHILFDDCEVLPDPATRVGTVLVEGVEVQALGELAARLEPLLEDLGESSDDAYLRDSRWPGVVSQASLALAAMVRAGGI
jgi:hypothetical protein